ncbi:unnamed protein product, partial [Gulo gulo]
RWGCSRPPAACPHLPRLRGSRGHRHQQGWRPGSWGPVPAGSLPVTSPTWKRHLSSSSPGGAHCPCSRIAPPSIFEGSPTGEEWETCIPPEGKAPFLVFETRGGRGNQGPST